MSGLPHTMNLNIGKNSFFDTYGVRNTKKKRRIIKICGMKNIYSKIKAVRRDDQFLT